MQKQNTYLLIAIIIPILMIVIIALSLFIPVKKITPKYNFLYAINDHSESYTCLQNTMAKLFPKTMNINFYKVDPGTCQRVKLYIYDFNSNTNKSISFEEAKKLNLKQYYNLDNDNMYISKSCYNGPDIGLWSMKSSYNEVCLVRGNYKQLVDINLSPPNDSFIFIGWIQPENSVNQEMKP